MSLTKDKDQSVPTEPDNGQKYHFTENHRVNTLLNKMVDQVQEFTEVQLDHIRRLTQIGAALSAERNLERLLEIIIDEARKFTNADGGTLYIMSDDEDALQFAIVQNESLNIRMGGTGDKITWSPVALKNPDDTPNYAQVSAFAALSGEVVNIPDVYNAAGFNFEGTKKFDSHTGYRSRSMLVVPMRNHENDIIGVMQLLNARDMETGAVVNFSLESQRMTESLASQAAVALTNQRLIQDLENLLESFIRSIGSAVDEKSPYTGGHIRRVAELTVNIARKVNEADSGPMAKASLKQDELRELRIAAWLHDVGKIITPEYVIDKSTKLETIFDRIEILKARFEVIKRDYIIEKLKRGESVDIPATSMCDEADGDFLKQLEDDLAFLEEVNLGAEFMADGKLERLQKIAGRKWLCSGESRPLLTEDEIKNLSIRRGTLTDEEREVINNHALVTMKMLSQLPFPRKLKNVPIYAATHHEKLDGSGYPWGWKADQLGLQSRILALADIFEALTARDRPYKKGKTLSEVVKIMGFMVKDKHIDGDLFDLFIKERLHVEYAKQELPARQADIE
jgi:HD-GYP domain-containing protein (c-di-GMP phosphodiesterase class II)